MEFQNSQLLKFVDYPESRKEVVENILESLSKHGVELESFIAKGFRSTVFKGKLNDKEVAIKILRSDSGKEKALLNECNFLKKLKEIAPKPFICSKDFIVMEFIKGKPFKEALEQASDIKDLKKLIMDALKACYKLDTMKIKHSELKGEKHVIFSDGKIRIIDFESATESETPGNLPQFAGFHLVRNEKLLRKIGVKKEDLLEALKEYKSNPGRGFEKVKEVIERDR